MPPDGLPPAATSEAGADSMALAANLPGAPGVIPRRPALNFSKGIVMSRITAKGPLVTLAVVAGLLAAAGPVSASAQALSTSAPVDPTKESFSIDIGTSERIAVAASTVVTDNKDPDKLHPGQRSLVFSGDAYDNEMGLTSERQPRPESNGIIAILIG